MRKILLLLAVMLVASCNRIPEEPISYKVTFVTGEVQSVKIQSYPEELILDEGCIVERSNSHSYICGVRSFEPEN